MRRPVSSSLSIVLVTHDRESSLNADVVEFLDIASDFSSYIELLILDDGSTDETRSVALGLARRYPQVYVHHNAMRYGNAAAMQTAMRETVGEFVLVCTEVPSVSQLRNLWSVRTSPKFVMGKPADAEVNGSTLRLFHRPSVVSQIESRTDTGQTRVA